MYDEARYILVYILLSGQFSKKIEGYLSRGHVYGIFIESWRKIGILSVIPAPKSMNPQLEVFAVKTLMSTDKKYK